MSQVCHLIGNGESASLFDHSSRGIRVACNLPPFAIHDLFASVIVDFKMMKAIQDGIIDVPGDWVLGFRPKIHLERNPTMYLQRAHQIREFYTVLPKYCPNYTDFSCGHMAHHYMCTKFRPKELHMYGFNSIFDFDLYSTSDLYMPSARDNLNNTRLTANWRRVWPHQFAEFPNIKFYLHGRHKNLKIQVPDNVEVVVHK